MGMKHCNSCNEDKYLDFFGKDKHSKDGFTNYCKECRNRDSRQRAAKNPEIYKRRNDKHKEKRKEYYSRPENKRRFKSQALKQAFGISIEEYDAMLKLQNGVCAVCFKEELTVRNKNLAVDHCHKTGKIRGLLCSHCNRAIGLLGDNPTVLENALNYLRKAS